MLLEVVIRNHRSFAAMFID